MKHVKQASTVGCLAMAECHAECADVVPRERWYSGRFLWFCWTLSVIL